MAAPIPAAEQQSAQPAYYASIYPGPQSPLPPPFVDAIKGLESSLAMPVWMLLQTGDEDEKHGEIDEDLADAFFAARNQLPATGRSLS